MSDNLDPGLNPGNPDPNQNQNPNPPQNQSPNPKAEQAPTFSWQSQIGDDLASAPSIKKFPDTKEGLVQAATSYIQLEKLLGNDKVPIPKGPNDVAARARFNKALGIPDSPNGYTLADVEIPKNMEGLSFDKAKFAEVAHKHDLTPGAAKGLWETYTNMVKQQYANTVKASEEAVTAAINTLREEWGDAYKSKVDLGQMVINRFSDDKEMNDYVTAVLSKDARGIKFLAKIGEQFAENKIGDFKYQRHSLTPDEAQSEWDAIRGNPAHPYNNDRAPQAERDRAIAYVNSLIRIARQRPVGQA